MVSRADSATDGEDWGDRQPIATQRLAAKTKIEKDVEIRDTAGTPSSE